MELSAGTVVGGRYLIEAMIGQGGMAAVYRVRHTQLDTMHALKVLTLTSRSVQRRLMQEGRVQAALNHPNIVSVTDVVDVDGAPGLVMEYVRGPSLDDFLLEKRLSAEQLDALVVPILDGVIAAHALDLIHRDLKPANVMLAITPHGLLPKVADFGLVKLIAEDGEGGDFSKTRSGVAMGTPSYMAPEQIRDAKNVDARADIFSIGAILYEMATGERAFDAPDLLEVFNKVASGNCPPIREAAPNLPERMYVAIDAALTTDRDQRVPTVKALKALWQGKEATTALWDEDLLSAAQAMGGGGDDTGEFLKRSFRSQTNYAPQQGDAALRAPGPTLEAAPGLQSQDTQVRTHVRNSAATMDLDSIPEPTTSLGVDATMAPEDFMSEQAAPAPVEAEPTQSGGSGRVFGLAAVLLLLVGGGALAIGGVTLAVMNGGGEPPAERTEPSPTPEAQTVADTKPDVPVADPTPAPTPVPTEPDAPALVQAAAPAPPAPEAPPEDPGTAEPTAAPSEPDPPQEAAGTAEADPEPPASAAPAPRVTVKSDVTVLLRNAAGDAVDPATAPPGRYRVLAFFDEQNPDEVSVFDEIELSAGKEVSILCARSRRRCKVDQ